MSDSETLVRRLRALGTAQGYSFMGEMLREAADALEQSYATGDVVTAHSEFYVGGLRFAAGTYSIRRVRDEGVSEAEIPF